METKGDNKVVELPVRSGMIHGEDVHLGEGQVLDFSGARDKYISGDTPVWRESSKLPSVGDIALSGLGLSSGDHLMFFPEDLAFQDLDLGAADVRINLVTSASGLAFYDSGVSGAGAARLSDFAISAGALSGITQRKLSDEEVRIIMLKVKDLMNLAAEGENKEAVAARQREYAELEQHLKGLA